MPEMAECIEGPLDGEQQPAVYLVLQVNACLAGFYALYRNESTGQFRYQWVYKPKMTSV